MSTIAILLVGVLGTVTSLILSFLPTIIAYIRGNINKNQILKYQIAILVISVAVGILSTLISLIISFVGVFISAVWSIATTIVWFYILYYAIKDFEITILNRFGIKF